MTSRKPGSHSPYLKMGRLSDVIAALQVIAVHESSTNKIADWTFDLSRDKSPKHIEKWTAVFAEHPEFFIVYSLANEQKAAMRWRYANRTVDRKTDREYSLSEKNVLSAEARASLTTKPLSYESTNILLQTTIAMRREAIQEVANSRWWIPPATGLATGILGFIGALVGVFLGKHS